MKEKIKELKERRAKIIKDQRALYDKADAEKRELTAEEQEQFDRLDAEFDKVNDEVRKLEADLERREKLEKRKELLKEKRDKNGAPNPAADNDPENRDLPPTAQPEYRAAWWGMMRTVRGQALPYEEQRALNVGSDPAGGYIVPDEFNRMLIEALADFNVMRTLATVITTSSGNMETPIVADHGIADWTDEMGDYIESDVVFDQIILGAYKATTIIKVSEELLYDNAFDLEAFLVRAYARRFGTVEEAALVDGDGTKKPTGILRMADVGVTPVDTVSFTSDELIDLYHSLRRPYRPMATWIMNDNTVKMIRKMKDNQGNYLWQPGLQAGEPDRILGRPVAVAEAANDVAPLARPVAFGDISYYWIADRQGRVFQRLNELYAAQGMIGFKAYQRVDGKLVLSEACKVMEMPNTAKSVKAKVTK